MNTSDPPPEHDGIPEARLLFRNTMRITEGHLDEYQAAIVAVIALRQLGRR